MRSRRSTSASSPPSSTSSTNAPAVARTTGGVSLEVDGLTETLKAFRGLEADLRKEANSELRAAARALEP